MTFEISGGSPGIGMPRADFYETDSLKAGLSQLAASGGTHANFRQIYYQDDWASNDISTGILTQTDQSLISGINFAKSQGLETSLYILMETKNVDPALRYTINPTDPATWFREYKDAVIHTARIAAQTGVDFLTIGGELAKMSTDPSFRPYWLDIISAVREVYSGTVAFGDAWKPGYTPVDKLSFADALDMVGISFYNPTSSLPNATVQDMVDAWYGKNQYNSNYVEAIKELNVKYHKPIFFSEISTWAYDGATSASASNELPAGVDWHDPNAVSQLKPDLAEQANYFEAAYRVWTAEGGDWMKGFLWWDWYEHSQPNWPAAAQAEYAVNFSPNGKPAGDVITHWNVGGAQNEIVNAVGTSKADFLLGRDGNDHFRPMEGNDYVNGGKGIDEVTFNGIRSQFAVDQSEATISAKSLLSGDQDILTNIERLRFSDGVLAFDIDGNAGQAYRIYKAAFDRTPDVAGLSFWINALDGGKTLIDVANGFINSAEFQAVYGASADDAFVARLYENVLGRAGEPAGLSYWGNQLDAGMSRTQVLAEFSESSENVSGVAPTIADGIWYN